MNFGNLQGLVNGTEQVVFDYKVTGSAVSSISTGNILNGNEDGWYTIIFRLIADGTVAPVMQINGDTGNNYGRRGIQAVNTTTSDYSGNSGSRMYFEDTGSATGRTALVVANMYAKSGAVRLVNSLCVSDINGTTVTRLISAAHVWNNTADNIVSLSFPTGNCGVGSRVIILKTNNFTNGTPTGIITTPYIKGAWVRVGSSILGSPASSITFSGLDGDRDVLYYLSAQYKIPSGASGYPAFRARLNNDSGGNYGIQNLRGASTTVSGYRDGAMTHIGGMAYGAQANNYAYANLLIFAKSGFVRPAIGQFSQNLNGTTVEAIDISGGVWNDTSNNITSIVCPITTNNYDTASQFDLYALRPDG